MALWAQVFLCAAALCGGALSGYVEVDESVFQHFGGGQKSLSDAGTQFKEAKKVTLPDGKVKEKLIQYHDGLRVLNTGVVATVTDHGLKEVSGSMFKIDQADEAGIRHSLNNVDPLEVAKKHVREKTGLEELPIEHGTESVEQVIIPTASGHAQKVFAVNFFYDATEPRWPHFYIDGSTGAIVDQWEGLDTAGNYVAGSGPGGNSKTGKYMYGPDKTHDFSAFMVSKNGNKCTMENSVVKTVNLNHSKGGPTKAFEYDCGPNNENVYKPVNGAFSPMNDATYFGKVLYDMYRDWAQTDPLKFKLSIRVHYGTNYENAFWNGRELTFGDGKSKFYPLVDLNVVTHEAAHGFTGQNSGLVYRDQSGGMNEAYSDIAGEAAEFYMKGKVDWMVGAEIIKAKGRALRYFDDPTKDGRSIRHFRDFYPQLDVHLSSGLYNRAFYLICNSAGWDIKKAFQAFTKANQLYWTSGSTFEQGACGVKKAAIDLGFDITTLAVAFADVGIPVCGLTTAPPPTAAPTAGPPPFGKPSNCGFEKDFCGWSNPKNSDGNQWKQHSGSTSSSGTGPSKAIEGSYYIYMETSSGTGNKGAVVELQSARLTAGTRCLNFWYHMYGATMGSLEVDIMSTAGRKSTVFTKSGNQGNVWRSDMLQVPMANGDWISIRGIKGSSFTGDAAIDKIVMTDGACQAQTQPPTQPPKTNAPTTQMRTNAPTTAAPSGPDCEFETGPCAWQTPKNHRNNYWQVKSGSTPSSGTGPSGAAPGAGQKYIYMEASSPGARGDRVDMISPALSAGTQCMSFLYHMYGASMGNLAVSVVVGTNSVELFKQSGNQGNNWMKKQLTVKSDKTHTVMFSGTIGTGWSSDIALDSIKFVNGPCAGPTTQAPTAPPTAPPTNAPTTAPPLPPLPVDCKFDLRSTCAWKALTNSAGSAWKLNSGGTPSSGTGPSSDLSGKGYYIFFETSDPVKTKSFVTLQSPTFRAGKQCLNFASHMYGSNMGELKVDIVQGATRHQVLSRLGDFGNKWFKHSVSIDESKEYKIEIIGVRGNGYRSDMALDEISFTPTCPPPPPTTAPPPPATLPPADSCGMRQPGRHLGVIGGVDAKRGDWPWQILMLNQGRGGCGGTLISDRWVVTAAHCVHRDRRASSYKVRVGDTDLTKQEGSEVEHQVKKLIVAPTWNPNKLRDDLALFLLEKPVQFNKWVQPACLPKHNATIGSRKCYISGWGKIQHPGNGHPQLQQAIMPPVDSKVCEIKNQKVGGFLAGVNITAGMVCAGEGGINPISGCHGDSGGPYVCEENGQWYVHGAVSHGSPRCKSTETYTVFARVNYFKSWIIEQMRKYA